MEKRVSRGEERSKLEVALMSPSEHPFSPMFSVPLQRTLSASCWQLSVDRQHLSQSLSFGIVVVGRSGSANSCILLGVGAPTYWLVWGHKGLALLAQFSPVWRAIHSVSMASGSVWGDPEFLRGWRRATFPSSLRISRALSSSRHLVSSLVYSCFLSSFHRQAQQEHFWKTWWTNIIVHPSTQV